MYMCEYFKASMSCVRSLCVFECIWKGGGFLFCLFSTRVQCAESVTMPSIYKSSNNMDIIYMLMRTLWLPPVTRWTSLTVDNTHVS